MTTQDAAQEAASPIPPLTLGARQVAASTTASTSERPPTQVDERLAYRYPGAAEKIGVSVSTLKRLVRDGRLKTVTLGGCRLVLRAELERLLDDASAS